MQIAAHTLAMKKLKLWSLRTNAARGNYWKMERDVTEETATEWLAVYRADEPGVCFLASDHKPKTKKNA